MKTTFLAFGCAALLLSPGAAFATPIFTASYSNSDLFAGLGWSSDLGVNVGDSTGPFSGNGAPVTASASDAVAPDTVQLTIGADFPADQYLTGSSTAAVATPVTTVDATATGTQAPAPTDLTEMAGTNTPCVK